MVTDQVIPPVIDQAAVPADPVLAADPAVVPPAPKSAPKTPSPLDVLDQILNDAQAKSKQVEAQKEEEKQKQIQAEIERKKQEDQQKIAAELAALQDVKYSPQYQAKVEQDQEQNKKDAEYKDEMAGMEIVQLGHTKV